MENGGMDFDGMEESVALYIWVSKWVWKGD